MVTIWSFARIIAPVVTTTSIILSSNKIQNGDVLILANPDPSGKWPLKWREGGESTCYGKYNLRSCVFLSWPSIIVMLWITVQTNLVVKTSMRTICWRGCRQNNLLSQSGLALGSLILRPRPNAQGGGQSAQDQCRSC